MVRSGSRGSINQISRTHTGEGTDTVRLTRGDMSEMQMTVKESLTWHDFSRDNSPPGSHADQDAQNRSQDLKGVEGATQGAPGAVVLRSNSMKVAVASTLDQIQEQPEAIGGRKDSEEDVGTVPERDTQVFEALQQLRRIIGSSNNLRKEFEGMDINGDQLVSLEEFHYACAAMGTGLKPDELTAVFNLIDLNKNGTLEFDEFIEAFDRSSSLTAMQFVAQQRIKEEEEASLRSGETGGGDAPPNSEETAGEPVGTLEAVKEI